MGHLSPGVKTFMSRHKNIFATLPQLAQSAAKKAASGAVGKDAMKRDWDFPTFNLDGTAFPTDADFKAAVDRVMDALKGLTAHGADVVLKRAAEEVQRQAVL